MNTFIEVILVVMIVFTLVASGVNMTSNYYIKHLGTDITEDLKYEKQQCVRSEPKHVPCKIRFVKENH